MSTDLENKKISPFEMFAFFLSKIDIKVVFAIIILTGCLFYHVIPESSIGSAGIFSLSENIILLITLLGYILSFLLFFYFVDYFIKNGFVLTLNPVIMAILAYFAAAIASILINGGSYMSQGFSDLRSTLERFSVFYAMFYVLKQKDHLFIVKCIIVFLGVNCVISYADIILDFGDRSGLFVDQNKYGKLLVVAHAFFFIHFFTSKSQLRKIIIFLILAIIFVNVLMISSRGTYVLYFFATAIIIWQTKSIKIITLGILAMLFVGALFGYMTMRKITERKMDIVNNSDIGRISTNITGLRMWREHPVIGIGYATSRYRYKEFEDKNAIAFLGMYTIHNIYVAQLAETGIIGFLLFGLFNGILIMKLITRYKSNGKLYKDKYSLFYISAIVTYLLHGLVYHTFEYEGYYWFILAAALLYLKEDDKK